MAFDLAPEAQAAGYRLLAQETTGSTNADALELLRAGDPGPVWVVSRHQSRGRGRRGSAWETEPGNLAATLALTTSADAASIATLGFVAGLALVAALERCCVSFEAGRRPAPQDEDRGHVNVLPHAGVRAAASLDARPTFSLKWPNDVLADGAKLAGILLETEVVGTARAVVIGIGVNVAHAPEGLPYRTASLLGLGSGIRAEDLFTSLSAEWTAVVAVWDEGRGFGALREQWLAKAVGLGGPVVVKSGAGQLSGVFETIDRQGQLVLRAGEGGLATVSAGDVYFGAAATVRPEAAA